MAPPTDGFDAWEVKIVTAEFQLQNGSRRIGPRCGCHFRAYETDRKRRFHFGERSAAFGLSSHTRLPEIFDSKSHNAQSSAFRAAHAGRSLCRRCRSSCSHILSNQSARLQLRTLPVTFDRHTFAAARVFSVTNRHENDSRFGNGCRGRSETRALSDQISPGASKNRFITEGNEMRRI